MALETHIYNLGQNMSTHSNLQSTLNVVAVTVEISEFSSSVLIPRTRKGKISTEDETDTTRI